MKAFFDKYPIEENVIAAGVSGGADSLALVLRLKEWGDKHGKRVVALTVDHGLRAEAAQEAAYVAKVMRRFGIEHHILEWKGEKPARGIEEAAREARYALIGQWCRKAGVKVFATGHHRRDQAETFLLRLIRGSGVFGLSGILPVSERQGLLIVRPQLYDSPERLKDFLREKDVAWVEDPSNQNEDFLRVKIRNFLPELSQKLGLTEERLATTATVLGRTRSFVESEAERFMAKNCRMWGMCGCSLCFEVFFTLHEELRFHVLARLLKRIGNSFYMPESAEVLRLCSVLSESGFKGCTLNGCEIIKQGGKVWIIRECREPVRLGRKEWDDFAAGKPEYKRGKLPYKLRRLLFAQQNEKRS